MSEGGDKLVNEWHDTVACTFGNMAEVPSNAITDPAKSIASYAGMLEASTPLLVLLHTL